MLGFSQKSGNLVGAFAVLLTLGAVPGSMHAQLAGSPTVLTEPAAPLLPQRLGSMERSGDAVTGSDPAAADPAAAPVLKEDGLQRFSTATYSAPGSPTPVQFRVLQFGDATGAFSAFTFFHRPSARDLRLPDFAHSQGEAGGNQSLFRQGTTVIFVNGAARQSDLQALLAAMPKVKGPSGFPPLLPTYIPSRDLLPGSVRYSLGPVGYKAMGGTLPAEILGFEKSAEVATAQYSDHGSQGLLTLLLFPTPEIAGDRGRALESALNAAGQRASTAKLRREGPLVILATGFTPAAARDLVDSIHLHTEVTWNKAVPPEFHTEVRKTASLLVSIAVFSGVLGAAAVLLGLFLGFGRAWVRVLMGKPAATEPEFLRLDLSDRAIDTGAGPNRAGV